MSFSVIGVDSGSHCAISLLRSTRDRPELLAVSVVTSQRDALWLEKCDALLLSHFTSDPDSKLYIESPPKTFRGSLDGDRRGTSTWLAMGRRKGMIEAIWWKISGRTAISMDQKDWVSSFYPKIQSKKVGEGSMFGKHRIREAHLFISDPRNLLLEVSASLQVDGAESMLIGAAGIFQIQRASTVVSS